MQLPAFACQKHLKTLSLSRGKTFIHHIVIGTVERAYLVWVTEMNPLTRRWPFIYIHGFLLKTTDYPQPACSNLKTKICINWDSPLTNNWVMSASTCHLQWYNRLKVFSVKLVWSILTFQFIYIRPSPTAPLSHLLSVKNREGTTKPSFQQLLHPHRFCIPFCT